LIRVADQEQVRAGCQGLDQLIGQEDVQHAGFIHDHEVGGQGMVRPPTGLPAGAEFQDPMQGRRRMAGGLRHAFGGAPGRGRQYAPQPFGPGEGQQRTECVGLAGAGPACEDGDGAGQRHLHGGLLRRREVQPLMRGEPAERGPPVHPAEVPCRGRAVARLR
jgi:hypothetical protein